MEQPCCVKRPVGIAEHLAGENHHVSLARRHNLLGLHRLRDQSDRTGGNTHAGSDLGRKGGLIPGSGGNPGIGIRSTPISLSRRESSMD